MKINKKLKNVLITGAANGLGYELTKLFAKDNFNLFLIDNDKQALEIARKYLIKKYSVKVEAIATDLANLKSIEKIFKSFDSRKIKMDILINNAGLGFVGEFIKIRAKDEIKTIELNISSLTYLTKLFLDQKPKNSPGKILNIASLAAFQPGPLMAVYYASKSYVVSFSRALAEELSNSKITVSILCPGTIDTKFCKKSNLYNQDPPTSRKLILMSPGKVAQIAYRGLFNNRKMIIPGFYPKVIAFLDLLLPNWLIVKIVKRLNS